MDGKQAAVLVRMDHQHFVNVIQDFSPSDAVVSPVPGMMTAAQQIRHIAHSCAWFREGAWGAGFDLDFAKMEAINSQPATLAEARAELDAAFAEFAAFLETQSAADLMVPLPENPLFGQAPRLSVVRANCDHTAHHRGSLAVYLRLLGKTPRMPYAG